jgi:sorbitol-specific phosphotransferase system component IIBC
VKEWNVGLKLDLGETRIECIVTVKAGDRYDAVAAALAALTGGMKITSVTEHNPREKLT